MHRKSLAGLLLTVAAPTIAGATLVVGGANITVDGSPDFRAAVAKSYPPQEIYENMISSTETFTFQSFDHADEHGRVRFQILDTMNDFEGTIDFYYDEGQGFAYPDDTLFVGMAANPMVKTMFFQARPGVETSDALQSIISGTTRSDCLAVVYCADAIGHYKYYGAAWIDQQIPAGTLTIGTGGMPFFVDATDMNTAIPGDYRYMTNDPRYQEGDPAIPGSGALNNGYTEATAIWNGENCIYVGGGLYSGLGLLNRTEAEVRTVLQGQLNAQAKIQLTDADAKANITWDTLKRPKIFPPS